MINFNDLSFAVLMKKYFMFMDLWFLITQAAFIGWIRTWKLIPILTGFSLIMYL